MHSNKNSRRSREEARCKCASRAYMETGNADRNGKFRREQLRLSESSTRRFDALLRALLCAPTVTRSLKGGLVQCSSPRPFADQPRRRALAPPRPLWLWMKTPPSPPAPPPPPPPPPPQRGRHRSQPQAERAAIKIDQPDTPSTVMLQLLGERWQAADADTKAKYVAMHAENKIKADEARRVYAAEAKTDESD